jgi:hypothetical protein
MPVYVDFKTLETSKDPFHFVVGLIYITAFATDHFICLKLRLCGKSILEKTKRTKMSLTINYRDRKRKSLNLELLAFPHLTRLIFYLINKTLHQEGFMKATLALNHVWFKLLGISLGLSHSRTPLNLKSFNFLGSLRGLGAEEITLLLRLLMFQSLVDYRMRS